MQIEEKDQFYTQQLNIRLRAGEKKALEARARQLGKSLAEWGREALVGSLEVLPEERRRLIAFTIGSEINRLTIVAAQNGEDISAASSRERIEREARASAEVILDRWLSFLPLQKGAA